MAAGAPPAAIGLQQRERAFIAGLSAATGLSPRVVAAWVHAEGDYRSAGAPGSNFLNLRTGERTRGYSGVPVHSGNGGFAQFSSVGDAIRETAYWLTHMGNYSGIRAAAGKPDGVQLAAIARSPWDAGHYHGGRSLTDSYKAVTRHGGGFLGGVTGAVGDVGSAIIHPGRTAEHAIGAVTDAAADAGKAILRGVAELVVGVVLMALFAALIYQGVRRMAGDQPRLVVVPPLPRPPMAAGTTIGAAAAA